MSSLKKAKKYITEGIYTLTSIIKGHVITFKNLFRRKVTEKYPEVKPVLPDGYRGMPSLPVDQETGKDRCIGCQACVRICPTQLLKVDTHRGEDKKLVVDDFNAKVGRCVFCGMCDDVCPVDAIRMSKEFELSVCCKDELEYNRAKLNELGGVWKPKPKAEAESEESTPGKEGAPKDA